MSVGPVTAYRTTDGSLFLDKNEAALYEEETVVDSGIRIWIREHFKAMSDSCMAYSKEDFELALRANFHDLLRKTGIRA